MYAGVIMNSKGQEGDCWSLAQPAATDLHAEVLQGCHSRGELRPKRGVFGVVYRVQQAARRDARVPRRRQHADLAASAVPHQVDALRIVAAAYSLTQATRWSQSATLSE